MSAPAADVIAPFGWMMLVFVLTDLEHHLDRKIWPKRVSWSFWARTGWYLVHRVLQMAAFLLFASKFYPYLVN